MAALVHGTFYALMVAMPIIGYLLVSANPPNPQRHLTFWALFTIPYPAALQTMERPAQIVLHDQFVVAHAIGGWIIVAALVLHLGGVVKHQFLDRSHILNRMNPFGRRSAR